MEKEFKSEAIDVTTLNSPDGYHEFVTGKLVTFT